MRKYRMPSLWIKIALIVLCCIIGYFVSTWQMHKYSIIIHRRLTEQQLKQNKTALEQRLRASGYLQSPQATAMDYYRAYKLYYDGVPDKYDNSGNKIKGLAPDSKKAIAYLSRACELSPLPSLWFLLGSIYQNGMYNFDPDLPMAQRLYTQILNTFPNRDVQYEAQDRLTDVITEINNIQTYRWLNLKYTPKKNQHHEKIKSLLQARTRIGGIPGLVNGFGTATVVDRIFRAPNEAEPVLDVNDVRFNDRHNTHNSQVVGTVAHSLKKLKDSTQMQLSLQETVRQIRDFINSKPPCDRRDDAQKSLDSIERNIIPINSINMKETEALNVVWNRINSDQHQDHRSDIKDIFYQQLADMQEHGKSVCATGRLSRMMDTFSTFDKDVVIKPTYVIDKEMMEKAGKLREDMYNGYDQAVADKLRAGTADPKIQEQFDKSAREKIVETLTKDYVDTGIMTENAFVKSVDEWIDEI